MRFFYGDDISPRPWEYIDLVKGRLISSIEEMKKTSKQAKLDRARLFYLNRRLFSEAILYLHLTYLPGL